MPFSAGAGSIPNAVPNQERMPLAGLGFPSSGRARHPRYTHLRLGSLRAHPCHRALLCPSSSCYLAASALDPAWRQMMCWAGMAKFIKLGWEALAGCVHNQAPKGKIIKHSDTWDTGLITSIFHH